MATNHLIQPKVLFIGHSAGLTGAPLVLLNLLKWIKEHSKINFEVLLRTGGELQTAYKKLTPTRLYEPSFNNRVLSRLYRHLNRNLKAFYLRKGRLHHFNKSSISLIFSNTITNGEVLSLLADIGCPVICQVHELDYWIQQSGSKNLEQVKRCTTHYIAVSDAVKKNLVQAHGIPENKVDVVHGFIPIPKQDSNSFSLKSKNIRRSLNISSNAFVVGASGSETWRKGKDLFVQMAYLLSRKLQDFPIYFIWVGGRNNGMDFYGIQHDIRHTGLEERVRFVEEVSNPLDYYAAFDIFAMTSREDPYPLVNLEVAALGKPIVCFENAGGSPEFVENDAGFVVPYLDIHLMAEKIITLAEDKELRNKLGHRAAQKVQERHDITVAAPKILKIIERFF